MENVAKSIIAEYMAGDEDAKPIIGDMAEERGMLIHDFIAANLDDDEDIRKLALAQHLNCEPWEIDKQSYEPWSVGMSFRGCGAEYWICTDDEADGAWDQSLESYIDECMEIPEAMAPYFDREAWKRDARHDGRGHSLSPYDGEENEVQLNGDWFFIYRTN